MANLIDNPPFTLNSAALLYENAQSVVENRHGGKNNCLVVSDYGLLLWTVQAGSAGQTRCVNALADSEAGWRSARARLNY
jgi:hypothetical protein